MAFRSTKKAPISEYGKNYIFRDNKCFVKMSVNTLPNDCGRTSSKTSVNEYQNKISHVVLVH